MKHRVCRYRDIDQSVAPFFEPLQERKREGGERERGERLREGGGRRERGGREEREGGERGGAWGREEREREGERVGCNHVSDITLVLFIDLIHDSPYNSYSIREFSTM